MPALAGGGCAAALAIRTALATSLNLRGCLLLGVGGPLRCCHSCRTSDGTEDPLHLIQIPLYTSLLVRGFFFNRVTSATFIPHVKQTPFFWAIFCLSAGVRAVPFLLNMGTPEPLSLSNMGFILPLMMMMSFVERGDSCRRLFVRCATCVHRVDCFLRISCCRV